MGIRRFDIRRIGIPANQQSAIRHLVKRPYANWHLAKPDLTKWPDTPNVTEILYNKEYGTKTLLNSLFLILVK